MMMLIMVGTVAFGQNPRYEITSNKNSFTVVIKNLTAMDSATLTNSEGDSSEFKIKLDHKVNKEIRYEYKDVEGKEKLDWVMFWFKDYNYELHYFGMRRTKDGFDVMKRSEFSLLGPRILMAVSDLKQRSWKE